MHDTALIPVQTNISQPTRAASLAQHLVTFLEVLLSQPPDDDTEVTGDEAPPRGAPAKVPMQQLWLALLIGTIRQAKHLSSIWRHLCLEQTGSFSPLHLTYEAVRKRLLAAGTQPLHQLFERVWAALTQWAQAKQPAALRVASFASEVVALDETTLDAVRRLTPELRELPTGGSRASRSAPATSSKRSWPTMISRASWMPWSGWGSTGLLVLATPCAWCSSRRGASTMAI